MKEIGKPVILSFILLTIAGGIVTWYFVYRILESPSMISLWIPFVMIAVWGVSVGVLYSILDSRSLALIVSAASMSGSLFFSGSYGIVGISALGAAIILWTAHDRMKRLKELLIKIQLWRIALRGLPYFFTAVALCISAMYYVSPPARSLSEDFTLSRSTFDYFARPIMNIVQNIEPAYTYDATLDDLIRANMDMQIEEAVQELVKQGVPEETARTLARDRIETYVQEKRNELADRTGTKLTGKETLGDLSYNFMIGQLNSFERYSAAVGVVIAIGIFFTLKAVGGILKYLVCFGIVIVFLALRIARLVEIGEVQVPKETVLVP